MADRDRIRSFTDNARRQVESDLPGWFPFVGLVAAVAAVGFFVAAMVGAI